MFGCSCVVSGWLAGGFVVSYFHTRNLKSPESCGGGGDDDPAETVHLMRSKLLRNVRGLDYVPVGLLKISKAQEIQRAFSFLFYNGCIHAIYPPYIF